MILSIIAFIINIGTTLLNVRAANRNRRRAQYLDNLESELLDYAMRMPDADTEQYIANQSRETRPPTTYRGNVKINITLADLDPERIADPELRHAVIMSRLLYDFNPN
ncbi:MAG: hypothetical protein NC401_10455 [Ruminococcus sp.]|nr:hypothetical protein [Ruminococcus sp.]MCM1438993.1 hypothetical protein [Roseburia sp.]